MVVVQDKNPSETAAAEFHRIANAYEVKAPISKTLQTLINLLESLDHDDLHAAVHMGQSLSKV